MSERRRLLMSQGEEDNPWEKLDYLTIVPLEGDIRLDVYHAYIYTYEYDEELDVEYENYRYCPFEYSLNDGKTWVVEYGNDSGAPALIRVAKGKTLKIRADINWFCSNEEGELEAMRFIGSIGKYAVAGTPMSLLSSNIDSMLNAALHFSYLAYCFRGLFQGDTKLVQILNPKTFLPATRVGIGSYATMFYRCTSLVNAPELPATSISDYCYQQMFEGCSSLINPPDLPSLESGTVCYNRMFYGCTSLIRAPKLPAKQLNTGCYEMMFYGCSSLVEAPEISAESLALRSCNDMFRNCKSLKYIKAMFLQPYPSIGYTTNWVSGVSPTGTFVKNKKAVWDVTGVHGIPTGWTVITE